MKDSNKCTIYGTSVFLILMAITVGNYLLTMNVDALGLIAASTIKLDQLYCRNETKTVMDNKCYYRAIE